MPVAYYVHPGAPGTALLPVVLLHGIACRASHWDAVTPALVASGRPVVTIDLPGHGESPANLGHQKLDDLVDAVTAVADAHGYPRFHLVGHSLGGGLSMLLADRHPDRVQSLTLVASGGLGQDVNPLLRGGALPGAGLGLRLAMTRPAVALVKQAAHALAGAGVRPYELSDNVLELFEHLTDARAQEAFMETLHDAVSLSGQKRTALDRLDHLDGSTVSIFWCSDDPVLPVTHGYRAHALLPGSALHIFSGHSHEPHNADPRRFGELLGEHLAAHDTPMRHVTIARTSPRAARPTGREHAPER